MATEPPELGSAVFSSAFIPGISAIVVLLAQESKMSSTLAVVAFFAKDWAAS